MGSQAFTETIPAIRTAGKFPRRAYRQTPPSNDWESFGPIALASPKKAEPWVRGAISEKHVEGGLTRLSHAGVAVLHNRRIPGTWSAVDQIAVTRSGIWVISAQRYDDEGPDTPARGAGAGSTDRKHELLFVGRRACGEYVNQVRSQVEAIRKVVGSVSVTGALCFVDSEWPLFGGSFVTRDVRVLWPELLVSELLKAQANAVDRPSATTINVRAVREYLGEYLKGA